MYKVEEGNGGGSRVVSSDWGGLGVGCVGATYVKRCSRGVDRQAENFGVEFRVNM